MAWAHVQGFSSTTASGAGTSFSFAFSGTVTSGNMVAGRIEWPTGVPSDLTSVTDDKGNTYSLAAPGNDGTNWAVRGFWLANITNTPKTLTATFANTQTGSQVTMTADEYSGGGTAAAIDKAVTNVQTNPGTSANAVTSGSVTTANAGELIYGVSGSSLHTSPVYSAGSGFTIREQDSSKNPGSEDQVQASAGAIAATFTDNTASDTSITTVMTFSPTVAGGGARSFGLIF